MPTEEQPEVITTSKFQILKPLLALIGVILLIVLGFILLRSTSPIPIPVTDQSTTTLTPTKTIITCPTVIEFCQKAKPIVKNDKFVAMGATLPPGTPIKAIFDGKVIRRSVTPHPSLGGGHFLQLNLTDTEGKMKAIYYLSTSEVDVKRTVTLGQQIATVSAQTINYLDGYNFAFVLLDENNQEISINQLEFK